MGRRVDNSPLSESGDVFPPCDHNRCQMVPRHVTGCESDWLLFFTPSPASSPWSQFFFFNSSRRVFATLVFRFANFSLVAYFQSAYRYLFYSVLVYHVPCLVLDACSRHIVSEIAYRSTQCNYHLTHPDMSPFFSSSR